MPDMTNLPEVPDLGDDGQLMNELGAALAERESRVTVNGPLIGALRGALAECTQIDADYPGWHAWLSNAGRAYASRALDPATTGSCGELLDADTVPQLRELLDGRAEA